MSTENTNPAPTLDSLAARLEALEAAKSPTAPAAEVVAATPAPAAAPAATPDPLSKAAPAIKVAKLLGVLALELQKDGGEVRSEVAKAAKVTVAKAGEAGAMLAKVAAMFGVDLSDPEMQGYELRWKISDAVQVLQQAATLEATLATLAATLGGAAPADGAMKSGDVVAKSYGKDVWPRDMNGTDIVDGVHVERPLGWGAAS